MDWEIAERIQLLEKFGAITATELAEHVGILKSTAQNWLSRMTNFKDRHGTVNHYLLYEPPERPSHREHGKRVRNEGTYRINPDCDWAKHYRSKV